MMAQHEAVFMRESVGPCDVHDWPTDGMARRLFDEMRATHGKGGVNACRPCLERARADAAQNAGIDV